jgi:ribulose-bisphosphate carboxylase large chain
MGACQKTAMSRITATYRVRAPRADIDGIARALSLEQSVEVAAEVVTDPFVAANIMGRVVRVDAGEDEVHGVVLGLSVATTGCDVAQTLNMLFGNSSLHAHVELIDVDFPAEFRAHFPGPRFGIAGIRERLDAPDRPLTCAALKPQGMPSAALAELCYTMARSGVDVVKDDHGLADQAYSPFAERVAACQRAVERARSETGRACLYAPSLVGSPRALAAQARIVRDENVGAVLLAPALVGMPAFAEFAATECDVPILAHPAYGGAARLAPPLLLGKLFRWLGADAVIFPNFGGRFAYTRGECAGIAANARSDWGTYRKTLPVPAGGLSVERVDEIVRFYGHDVMLLIGGSLLAAGERLAERAREFVAATHRLTPAVNRLRAEAP